MLVNLHTHSKILLLQQKIIAKKCDFSFAYLPCCSPLDHSVQKDLKFDKKKDVNEIVIKKHWKKNKHGNFWVRARVSPCSPLLQREVDAVIPKKKIMNLSPAIHCTRTVCSRVPAPFNFLKLCDCDICQFAKQVWSPPTPLHYYCITYNPPKNHTLWLYSCQVVRIVWCDVMSLLLQRVIISWFKKRCAVCVNTRGRASCQLLRVRLCRRVCVCLKYYYAVCVCDDGVSYSACVVSINNNKTRLLKTWWSKLKKQSKKKNYILNSKRVVSHFVPQLLQPTKFIHSFWFRFSLVLRFYAI